MAYSYDRQKMLFSTISKCRYPSPFILILYGINMTRRCSHFKCNTSLKRLQFVCFSRPYPHMNTELIPPNDSPVFFSCILVKILSKP